MHNYIAWWRHQIETFSALLDFCTWKSSVTGEFPTQKPVTRRFDVFFDLRLNEGLSKQSWDWWFETPSTPLWRHSNGYFDLQAIFKSWLIPNILSHTWVRYPGFWGHGVKCPILTTVVPGFPAIWLAVPFGANGAHLGICTLPEKIFFVCEISCFWVK